MAEERDFSIVFEKSKDTRTLPVQGAWGGISPDGSSIIAHLFVEYASLPNAITQKVKSGQRIDPNSGDRISRGDITREIQTTIVMEPERAVSVGKWLQDKGQALLDAKNK